MSVPFLFLLGCAPEPESLDTVPDGVEVVEPAFSGDEVFAELDAVFAAGLPDVYQLLDGYFSLLAQGDADCPGIDAVGFSAGCTASTGYAYLGVSTYEEFTQTGKNGMVSANWMLSGDFEILTPDGLTFDSGGLISGMTFQDSGVWASTTNIGGTWGYDALEGAMGEGMSAALMMTAGHDQVDLINLEGTITIGGRSVGFTPLSVDMTHCDGLQISTLQVRDPSGYWYTVTFDDPCSGCGTATFYDGQVVGQGCLDMPARLQALFEFLEPS